MSDDTTKRMIEDAADALGETLLRSSGDPNLAGYEVLARAALQAGFRALTESEPAPARVARVARAIYDKLHRADSIPWSELDGHQRHFWHDIARAAIAAADEEALTGLQ